MPVKQNRKSFENGVVLQHQQTQSSFERKNELIDFCFSQIFFTNDFDFKLDIGKNEDI